MTLPTADPEYAMIAAAVYQACNHFDPYLPPLSDDLAEAWGRLFAKHKLGTPDLLRAVDAVYDEHGSGYRPLPKDIIDAARKIRGERTQRESRAERQAREDRLDARPGVGETPAIETRPATADARRKAIDGFTRGFGRPHGEQQRDRVRDLVERQRAAAPPQPMPVADTAANVAVTAEDLR